VCLNLTRFPNAGSAIGGNATRRQPRYFSNGQVDQCRARKSSKFRLPGLRSPRLRWQTDAIPNGLSIAILIQAVRSGTNLNIRTSSAGYDVALWLAYIACMDDRLGALKNYDGFGTQEPVGIRNDANDVGLVHALGCLAPNAFGAASNP
jgi:hypothetical protein